MSKSERSPCRNPQKQCDRLYARVSAIALQKSSKIKRSPVCKSECDRNGYSDKQADIKPVYVYLFYK
ncbi:hypothetical protein [Nostoc sp.]|uniref:hypothetical protein n=1 Tax=Nostoc sp. TaxID=1180 RepID=UPI002FFA898C